VAQQEVDRGAVERIGSSEERLALPVHGVVDRQSLDIDLWHGASANAVNDERA
jgi:hypothetical protein